MPDPVTLPAGARFEVELSVLSELVPAAALAAEGAVRTKAEAGSPPTVCASPAFNA